MYNFEQFKHEIISRMKEALIEEYGQVTFKEEKVAKNNCFLTGLCFNTSENGKMRVQPIIYAEHLYAEYEKGYEMDEICETAMGIYQRGMDEQEDIENRIANIFDEKENIVLALVQTEGNEQWLQNVPHREYLDMSIMYRWFLSSNSVAHASAIVTNQFAQRLELSESDLYELAYENTRRIFSPNWFDVTECLRMNFDLPEVEPEQEMHLYGISNEIGVYGAASILYGDVMEEVANKIGSNLYLLPSSIHEFMVVSTNHNLSLDQLQELVHTVNFSEVDVDERLSNQVYHYDKTTKQITQVTNSPYRRLDNRQTQSDFEDMPDEGFSESEDSGIQMML